MQAAEKSQPETSNLSANIDKDEKQRKRSFSSEEGSRRPSPLQGADGVLYISEPIELANVFIGSKDFDIFLELVKFLDVLGKYSRLRLTE